MLHGKLPVRVAVAILAGFFIFVCITAGTAQAHSLKERFIEELIRYVDRDGDPYSDPIYARDLFENLGSLHRMESSRCTFLKEQVAFDVERKRRGEEPITGYLLTDEQSLQLGVLYYQTHRAYFDRAEREYGVTPDVLLGMFRMETWFGTCVGGYNALPALYNTFHTKAKSWQWVLDEMRALVRYCLLKDCNPNTLPSSVRGAIGFSQFLPSNYWKYAVDGDEDGEVNLFTHPDAILSTARFLSERGGWTREASRTRQRRAVWRYNPTVYAYVDPVFVYADTVRPLLSR